MKIRVDNKNKVVIAEGHYRGKKIKTIAKCNEDVFDEEFGKQLAEKKYDIKEYVARKNYHRKYMNMLHRTVLRCYVLIEEEQNIIDSLNAKISIKEKEINEFVSDYFKENK